jgi:hypothetical protein
MILFVCVQLCISNCVWILCCGTVGTGELGSADMKSSEVSGTQLKKIMQLQSCAMWSSSSL